MPPRADPPSQNMLCPLVVGTLKPKLDTHLLQEIMMKYLPVTVSSESCELRLHSLLTAECQDDVTA